MKEELEKLVAAGKITKEQSVSLSELLDAGFCLHRSWGLGKILSVDALRGKIIIDFEKNPEHAMDMGFASETLRPIVENHILARRLTEPEVLQDLADNDPLTLMRTLMASFNNKATADQIEQILVPYIVAPEDWKQWWAETRVLMKKCGNFVISNRKMEPIVYQPEVNSLQARFLKDFDAVREFRQKLAILQKIVQHFAELEAPMEVAEVLIPKLNRGIEENQRDGSTPELSLEAIFLRDSLKQRLEITSEEVITAETIWNENPVNGIRIIEKLPSFVRKDAIDSFKTLHQATWLDLFLSNINTLSLKFCTEVVQIIENEEDGLQMLLKSLRSLISQHQASSELLLWLAKQKTTDFEDIMNVKTLRAMFAAIENDQLKENKSTRLKDYILTNKDLINRMIKFADIEEVKDMTRSLLFSPAFDEMDKRAILLRIVNTFPAVSNLIAGNDQTEKHDNALIVSWASLERKKQEYADLVHNRIPANTKEIAVARSYGDLRENHEYKAAREQQKILMNLKTEMESDLDRARGTDFADTSIEEVGVGVRVILENASTKESVAYYILGAWDFDEEQNVISYLSPLAQVLMHKKIGEQAVFNKQKYTVKNIELPNYEELNILKVSE